jgi:hypothetical protein
MTSPNSRRPLKAAQSAAGPAAGRVIVIFLAIAVATWPPEVDR